MLLSQFILPSYFPAVFEVCSLGLISISALQIGSSVPFF